ncbi:MAG TPA: hypothetical protein VMZ25_08050 [Terriglobales bacterium]|nr:hypothetical protein [Terriglobales bacterium]
MSTAIAAIDLNVLAGQWRAARRIYPIYSAVLRQFNLGVEPCRELESPINRSEPQLMRSIEEWFERADAKIEAFQIRQILQITELGTEESLRALIARQLAYPQKTKSVRDKVDFLIVQYYAQFSPHGPQEDLSFDHFSDVLEPLVGEVSPLLPPFCAELDALLPRIDACNSLGELLNGQVIDRARQIKDQAEERYFSPSVLVAVARFNYLLRLAFFRLMHADLHAIRFALHGMEARGQHVCDCSAAGLQKQEPLISVRQICHDWKKPFRAAYSAGSNFKQLIAIRSAVEKALAAPLPVEKDIAVAAAANSLMEATAKVVTHVKSEPAPPARVPATLDLDGCLEQIAVQLINTTPKGVPVTNVTIAGTKLLLASWEVAAFVRGGNETSDALQRAVAARAVLAVLLNDAKSGEALSLTDAVQAAHTEAAQLQELIAKAKDAKNIDAAVNLAASTKRLLAAIDEAEKLRV